jgi:hypothetical protein
VISRDRSRWRVDVAWLTGVVRMRALK